MILIESQTRLIAIEMKIMITMKEELETKRERERVCVELVSSDITKFISQR